MTKAKYKINYNPVNYNNNTGMYESGSETFSRYEEAKANQWKCEKCNNLRFGTFKKLKEHKVQNHSY